MAPRPSALQTIQIGAESLTARGTAVAALKKLAAMQLSPSLDITTNEHRPSGDLWLSGTSIGNDASSLAVSGGASYQELPYALASIIRDVTPTTPGGGTNTRDWVFAPLANNADEYRSYTVEHGDKRRAARVKHACFTEFGLEFRREGVNLSGAMMAQKYTDDVQMSTNEVQRVTLTNATGGTFKLTFDAQETGTIAYNAAASAVQAALEALSNIDVGDVVVTGVAGGPYDVEFRGQYRQTNVNAMTADGGSLTGTSPTVAVTTPTPGVAPTQLSLVPVLGNTAKVYMDDTYAGLGTTKLTGAMATGFRIAGRRAPFWTLDADQESWSDTVDTVPSAEGTLMVSADSEGMALLERVRDNETRFFRIETIGRLIEGSLYYRLRIDFAAQVKAPSSLGDQSNVFAAQFPLAAIKDPTWGKPFEISVRNTLTGL